MKQNKFNNFTIRPSVSSLVTQLQKRAFCVFKGQPVRNIWILLVADVPIRQDHMAFGIGLLDEPPALRQDFDDAPPCDI